MTPPPRPRVRPGSYLIVFAFLATFLILAHGPLIPLPYFWDEIGQFVPASLDILHHNAWIPVSTAPNVHPPAVMAYLAAVWKIAGYSIAATRIAMLLLASIGALFVFLLAIELSRGAPGTPALIALAMFCISPLFYAQAMMAQLDMPAMGATALALLLFLQNRYRDSALACIVLVLIRETGVVVPAVFFVWLMVEGRRRDAVWFLLPLPGLAAWMIALRHATGHWLGNAEFARYNVTAQFTPARFLLALARRSYYLFVGSGHFLGTATIVYAWKRMPLLHDRPWRIAASLVGAYVFVFSATGGAVLERYLLPVLPLVYIAFAVSLQALSSAMRKGVLAALMGCLVAANFVNPVYPFPFENNLAFVSFVELERSAAAEVDARPGRTISTRFPLADALRNPEFGYVDNARAVREIRDFSAAEVDRLSSDPPAMLIAFDPTWDPLHLRSRPAVRRFLATNYGYVPQLSPEEIGVVLNMRIARRWTRAGQTMELLVR